MALTSAISEATNAFESTVTRLLQTVIHKQRKLVAATMMPTQIPMIPRQPTMTPEHTQNSLELQARHYNNQPQQQEINEDNEREDLRVDK